MDLLWKTADFSDKDFKTFNYNHGDQECRVLHALDDGVVVKSRLASNRPEDWEAWLSSDVFNLDAPGRATAVILCPRAKAPPGRLPDQSAILRYLPFDRAVLERIVARLHLHRAFATIINRGWPTFSRLVHGREGGGGAGSAGGGGQRKTRRKCISYNLRIEQSWLKDTALSISYFPPTATSGSKLYALFLGLPKHDMRAIEERLSYSPPQQAGDVGPAGSVSAADAPTAVAGGTEPAGAAAGGGPGAVAGGAQGAPAPVGAPTAAPSSVPAPPPRQRHSLPIHVPFSLINLFLELEKRRRFDQVEDKVTQMEDLVKNFGRLPHDSDDPLHHLRRHHRSKSTTNNTNSGGVRMTPANEEDPSNLVGLYLDVGHIRNGLEAWKAQMAGMVPFVGEMVGEDGVKKKKRRTRTTATRSAMDEDTESDDDDNEENEEDAVVFGGGTLDPAEYLQRTRDEYDVKIGKCAMVMEGTSLTFQMELSHLARQDANISIKDGKQMKAIAVLTMVFLPATFVATFMAVPIFDWAPSDGERASGLWYVYFAISVPLTVIVLGFYCWWISCFAARRGRVYSGIPAIV